MIGWSALGGNSVPGDPLAIRASAARLHSIADKVSQQSRLVQSVAGDGLPAGGARLPLRSAP